MLRNLDVTQLEPLLQLINRVWRWGSFLPSWRVAIVRPMLKVAILDALYSMVIEGDLWSYVKAFLANLTLRVKVGRATSSPRDISSGVLKGSGLSPFLFNLVLASLPDCIPAGLAFTVELAVYADDIAMWAHRPTKLLSKVKACLQGMLWPVADFLTSPGLQLSESKTQALVFHPRGSRARKST
ncbi:uncharacterized protein LOC144168168 [Haemaphysalis longicornis]